MLSAHWRRNGASALRALRTPLRLPQQCAACLHCSASSAAAASAGRTATPSTAAAAAAPRKLTYMQEQALLEEQRQRQQQQQQQQQQTATAPAVSSPADAPAVVAPVAPPQLLSEMVLRTPAQSSPLPVQGLTPMQRLQHSGLVARAGSRTVLMPGGARMLAKLERVLEDELEANGLHAQEVDISPAIGVDAADVHSRRSATTDAPYPTSLAAELPALTELLVGDFGEAARGPYRVPLTHAALRTRVLHPAPSSSSLSRASSSSLWSGSPKPTLDHISLHRSRRVGEEMYGRTLDSIAHSLRHVGLSPLVLESSPSQSARGAHGVDADLAHEVHVIDANSLATKSTQATTQLMQGNVLKCDKCEYVAKRDRAVSIPNASTGSDGAAVAHSTSVLAVGVPGPLKTFFSRWLTSQLEATFPEHACAQLAQCMQSPHSWRCEVLVERWTLDPTDPMAQSADVDADAPAPVPFLLIMRAGDEFNLAAAEEHVGATHPLVRIESAELLVDVLARTLPADQMDELRATLPPSLLPVFEMSLSASSVAPRFDPRPEVLFDNALLPPELDLDMEVLQMEQQQQEEEQQAAAEEEEEARRREEQEQVDAAAADESNDVTTAALHARMERGMLSSAKQLRAGETLDLVAVEMAAKGLDVTRARAELFREGERVQREQHEAEEREREEEARRLALQARADAAQEEDGVVDELAPADINVEGGADLPLQEPAEVSAFSLSSSLPYSRQGTFRLAQPGEKCAMSSCEAGQLQAVRTHVLANSVFIGRQELVAPAATTGKRATKTKKQYVHTAYARFSTHDALALLASQALVAPSPLKSASAAGAAAGGVSLDTLTRLQLPALLAPYQLAILPVLSAEGAAASPASGNLRDFHRNKALQSQASKQEAAKADEKAWQTALNLHSDLLALSHAPLSAAQASAGLPADFYPALEGDVLLDDRTSLPVNARVQSMVSLGVPVLVLVQPRALAAGQVSLVLNRPGVSMQPRRVQLEGLAPLLLHMLRAAHQPVIQSRKQQREKEEQRRREEEEMQQQAEQERAEMEADERFNGL